MKQKLFTLLAMCSFAIMLQAQAFVLPVFEDVSPKLRITERVPQAKPNAQKASSPTSGTCGENLIWELTNGVLTISGTGAMTDYDYDANLDAITSPWYSLQSQIQSVVVADGVTSIGSRAFMRCSNVTSVTIGKNVVTLGHRSFRECTSLTSIEIPNSVTNIGEYAFYRCTGLTSVTISEGVTSIGLAAFYQCSSLTEVTIPESVTTIGQGGTFQYCTTLTKVQWNAKNCTIEPHDGDSYYYPFYGDENLTEVTFGDKVESIPTYLCAGLTELKTVHLPNSVKEVGENAFDDCDNLTSPILNSHLFVYMPRKYEGAYNIPEGIETICYSAFNVCKDMTSVTIPSSVTSIGVYAFWGCTGLASITIPSSVTSIGGYAFNNVPNIVYSGTATGAPWGAKSMNGFVDGWLVYSDDTKTHLLACATSAKGDINLPESVTSIGNYSFNNCSGLTSITIPNSVTSIGEGAFGICSGLTSITIPNSVANIGKNAFNGCTGLTSPVYNSHIFAYIPISYSGAYTIPNGIETIAGGAFNRCVGLTAIEIPNSVTSIGDWAFLWCSGLTSLTIPNSVINIGEAAFQSCNFVSVTLGNSVTSIGDYAFSGCKKLTSITIPESVSSIGEHAFEACTGLTSIEIPNSVTSIGDLAFYYCTGLTSPVYNSHIFAYLPISYSGVYTIPDGIETIAGSAFRDCSSLTSVIIPNSVASIGNCAFSGCSGLTSIEIPNSVTSIGNSAFVRCTSLTSVTIPNSITSIGNGAFGDCTSLISVTIPNSVTNIGRSAFSGCTGLTSITIPESVTSIGSSAFYRCTGLTSVTCFATTPPELGVWYEDGYSEAFSLVDCSKIPLYVPAGSEQLYAGADGWKNFTNIYPIPMAEPTTDAQAAIVSTSSNSVTIEWPDIEGALSYIIDIENTSGESVCTLVFDAEGYLEYLDYPAMSAQNKAPQRKAIADQVEKGWQYIVSGLTPDTEYTYSIVAKNAEDAEIYSNAIVFVTSIATSLEDLHVDSDKAVKVLKDGKLYILSGEKVYTVQGQEVR